ncbi:MULTISPECIES: DNA-3-methyladenine glycosylase family protein [Streptomyces]|uniref:DNA-3-methyladenine glycosylase 2 family protein n=1 Tax=Streptomyces antibioticus TaxID=1890 RepID=A0AAE6Y8H4_STRAT|nr:MULTISPECIES: DNA-3-methyladenine glycosylase [Streptomyces]MCX4738773.1 DNA-3-methyladenine glycosylase [Streptomyces antibioticus]QIT44866.1 DNA-3-methyladenine glycosylase 2 family protein [Streptomyces antibioticus]SMF59781.1 3-methyladenine DNA glycosylase/8-oxoguanine DNA glycosylase [Streptomyces sp. Amel2xC10]
MAGRFAPRPTRTTVRGGHVPVPPAGVPRPARAEAGRVRTWVSAGPVDLGLVLGPLRRGPGDPTFRAMPDGSVWRASLTPSGPGTLRVSVVPGGGAVRGEAWGPGGEWLLDGMPDLLGASDEPEAFAPRHRVVALARHRRPGLRLTRTGLVLESLIPSVLEQKVTTDEAYRAWRLLVRKFGEPAPGPAAGGRLWVMPAPRTWALIPSWEWHRAGVDDKRASTILRAVRVAARMEEASGMEAGAAQTRLELVPGIGPWTSAETVQRSHGAADAVTVGDLHLPGIVGWALAGNRSADDAEMLELLEPYAGQRHRAARLILLSGRVPERRAPRMTRGDIGKL